LWFVVVNNLEQIEVHRFATLAALSKKISKLRKEIIALRFEIWKQRAEIESLRATREVQPTREVSASHQGGCTREVVT